MATDESQDQPKPQSTIEVLFVDGKITLLRDVASNDGFRDSFRDNGTFRDVFGDGGQWESNFPNASRGRHGDNLIHPAVKAALEKIRASIDDVLK
jgi:hypothetical protein